MDEESVKMLFGEEIGGLCDDGFEGSSDEHQIFMEVLHGNHMANMSKRCAVTDAFKFEMEEKNHSNASMHSNCKDMTGVSLMGMKESSGEDVHHVNGHFGCSSVKCIKLSDKICNNENDESSYCFYDFREDPFQSKPSKEVACSGHDPDFVATGETITCHLVESCSQGIISSCVLLGPHGETDVRNDADDWKAYNKTRVANPIQRYVKKVTVSKSIFSPVSEESSVLKLLPNSAVLEEIPVAPIIPKEEGSKESDILRFDTTNVTSICVLPSWHRETDVFCEADGGKASNEKRVARSLGKYGKEVIASKAVMQPISQESSMSDVLFDGAIAAMEEIPVAPTVVEGHQESDCLKPGAANVTSGCVLLGQHGEANIIDEADDQNVSNTTEVANQLPEYVEEVTVSKAVLPATSQESSMPKPFPSDDITLEEMPAAPIAVEQVSDESAFSQLCPTKVASGCDLLSRPGETDITDQADHGEASGKTEVGSLRGKHCNEAFPTKDIMLPLSLERSASLHFPNSAISAIEEMPVAPIVLKEGSQESGLSKLGLANMTLGCVLFGQHGETDSIEVADDGKASNETEALSPDEKCVKEVTVSESIMPPVSQESSVSKLLNGAIVAVEEIPFAPVGLMEKSHECDLSKSGDANVTAEEVFQMHMQTGHGVSSSQDVVSSCVPPKHCRKVDVTNEVDDGKATNRSKRARPPGRNVKKVATSKAILTSVSPECSASRLSPETNMASEGLFKRSLRSHSCTHINLVESSSQGAVSSYAIMKQCRDDTADLVDDGNASNNIEVESPCEKNDMIVSKLKATSVSVSQKSSPSEILLTGAIVAIEEKSRALKGGAKEGSQVVDLLMTGMLDEALKEDYIRNLRPRLREHVRLVLTAAGWDVVIRERGHRPSYFDTLFATPKQKLVCKLPKAWRSCGKSLFAGGIRSVQKENMQEWADIDDFWNGLSITLAYIEKEMEETETSLSLAQRWCLLDPYVTMVCIDRKIGALRSGKTVKVVNGVSVVSDTSLRTRRKYTRKNQIAGISRDQVGSSDQSKRKMALLGDASTMTSSNLSPSEDLHLNMSVAQESAVLYLESSKTWDLKSDESVLMNQTVGCTTQGESISLDLNFETDGMDAQEVKQRTNTNTMRSGNGMIKLCKDDRPNHLEDLTGCAFEAANSGMEYVSTAVRGIASMEEMQKKTRRKYGHTRKKFKSTLESNGIKSVSKRKKAGLAASPSVESHSSNLVNLDREQEDFGPGNFKKSRKFFGSMIASVHNGKLLIANQESGISMDEQHLSYLFPHENVCWKVDGNCQEDVLANGKTQPDKNCCGVDGKIENSLDLSFHQGKRDLAFGSKFARGAASATGREIAKIILATGPELGSKRSKKSRKISEIKATKSFIQHKHDLAIPQKVGSQNVDFINSNKVDNGITHGHSRKKQKCLIDGAWKGSALTSPVSSLQCQYMSPCKLKKLQHLGGDFKELVTVKNNGKSQIKLKRENDIDEASLHCATYESVDPRANRKFPKMKKSIDHIESGRKGSRACPIDDDELLIAAIIKNKDFSSNSKPKAARKLKSQRRSCKLLVRSLGKGGKMDMKFSTGKRTVLSWLLDAGVLSMNDVIQYRSRKDGVVIKDGRVTRDGVFCKCCGKMLSVSEFKIHAGFKQHRPCLHLFMESGKAFTLCQLQAWSSEYKARKGSIRKVVDEVDQNDDTCGICGDGGELICCDNCPSTFHQSCLFAQELPDGNWYCSNCTCGICGNLVSEKEASSSLVGSQCSQCEHKYHKTCMNGEHVHEETVSDPWFCGRNCQEIYSGLHSRIGVLNNISDGFSWMLLRCIHGEQKVYSAQRFALMAECNIKLAVALSIMEECFVPMVDPRTGISMIPHVLYNWGSDFARLNYQGFYTVVLEKDDKLVSVASIRVHGVTVAEMPLIATCSEHRRQGMCRRLMNAIEEMLKSLKVQMLVISAIPHLVDTWTSGFGFTPIDGKEREKLNNINLMVFPGTMLLKKSLNGIEPAETKQTGLCVELSPRTEVSGEERICNERNSLVPALHSAENDCFVGIDLGENPAPQNYRIFQLEEQSDGQLNYSTQVSSGGSVHEDLSSVDCLSEKIEPLDICDASELVSAKPVVVHDISVANATPTVSSDFPIEEFCGAYFARLQIAEAHSGGGFVARAIDANSLCHPDAASHNDVTTELADGELNQLQSISTWRQPSNSEKLLAFAGTNFSSETALTLTPTNELLANGQVDGSLPEPNNVHPLRENHSHLHGNSEDFMEAVTTSGGTDAVLASLTGYADPHIDSTHFRSNPGVCKKHEDTIITCLLEDDHEHHDNASGQEPKSPGLTEEHGRIQNDEVDASVDFASENRNNNQNDPCFVSSTKLASSSLVKPLCQAPSPKISIHASSHK